jgi:hypothetical protein
MLDLLVTRELMLACYLLVSILAMLACDLLAACLIKSYAKIIYLYVYYSVVVCQSCILTSPIIVLSLSLASKV